LGFKGDYGESGFFLLKRSTKRRRRKGKRNDCRKQKIPEPGGRQLGELEVGLPSSWAELLGGGEGK